ncbi:type II toxin-antitoxin system VapC family toxin [Candidatus Poriferisodalis sp.]|uniref:type II toxin-antitoxin system VapC family toxin n=1 Tax=Candidatus Poriferisodalis sp. TaxID=3101277 RepID=UPI003B5931D0
MLILDTNVVSELMREHPRPEVLAWIDRQLTDDLYVTAVTEAEVRTGIAMLPEGERRRGLSVAAARAFEVLFADRVLSFDSNAAQAYAAIAAARRASGHPISQADCQIAAIARSLGTSVATRNVSDFEGCGIDVVNPWTDA